MKLANRFKHRVTSRADQYLSFTANVKKAKQKSALNESRSPRNCSTRRDKEHAVVHLDNECGTSITNLFLLRKRVKMTTNERNLWKNWADALRQKMMANLAAEVTKSVASITSETATSKTEGTVQSSRFWKACQSGVRPNDSLMAAGFEIEFVPDDDSKVREVTFRLNETWMTILNGVLERKNA